MTRIIAALAGLLAFSGLVLADGPYGQWQGDRGTVVLWRGIAALHGQDEYSPNPAFGGVEPASGWFWVEGGKASLNVDTGRFRIEARYVSWAYPTAKQPIGAKLGGAEFQRQGLFVCDSLGLKEGSPVVITTAAFSFDETASINLSGVIHDLPSICHDYPDQIAFLIGGAVQNNYFLFGTGRAVLTGY